MWLETLGYVGVGGGSRLACVRVWVHMCMCVCRRGGGKEEHVTTINTSLSQKTVLLGGVGLFPP